MKLTNAQKKLSATLTANGGKVQIFGNSVNIFSRDADFHIAEKLANSICNEWRLTSEPDGFELRVCNS